MLSNKQVTKIEQDFMRVYEGEADALFRFVYFRIGNRESSLDIVQEAYLRTWHYLSKGREVPELRAFLYRIARNLTIDLWRSNATRKTQSLDEFLEEGGDVEEEVLPFSYDPIDIERALKLLENLEPVEYREVIYLRYIEELSIKETAEVLGISENLVSVRVTRGIKKLNAAFIT